MTEQEKKKLEEEKKRKQVNKEDYNHVITEDGTLGSFGFTDNYSTKEND